MINNSLNILSTHLLAMKKSISDVIGNKKESVKISFGFYLEKMGRYLIKLESQLLAQEKSILKGNTISELKESIYELPQSKEVQSKNLQPSALVINNFKLKNDTIVEEFITFVPNVENKIEATSPLVVEKGKSTIVKAVVPKAPILNNLGGDIRLASKKHYTLQLSSVSQAESLFLLAKKQKLLNYLIYETKRYNRQWFVLVYGEYAGITQAKQALQQLLVALQKNSPWIRSIAHAQSEL